MSSLRIIEPRRSSVLSRFESKFVKPEPDVCWEWGAGTRDGRYGEFSISGRMYGAHRVSFALYRGAIPDGINVCHTCDNTRCVNPAHLFLGTQKQNVSDMIKKGRIRRSSGNSHYSRLHPERLARGSRVGTSKLTEDSVRSIRQMHGSGNFSTRAIADRFNITTDHVVQIVKRRCWKHV